MNQDKLNNLIYSINNINLNSEDLMSSVLDFSKFYIKSNPNHSILIDDFFGYPIFKSQVQKAAREAVVLAMSSIALDETVPFKEVFAGCINIEAQRSAESEICEDAVTKEIMKKFLSELRKELFSRVYSKNKEFNKLAMLDPNLLKKRYEDFMSQDF